MFNKSFVNESYSLDLGYIYNAESFVVGQKAKIVLHGRLKLGNKQFSITKLKNTKIKVNLTNSQNIKSLYTFSIDEWSESGDKEI